VISETSKPVYLVDAYSDPVVIRIEGRASFLNSACLRDFMGQMLKSGKTRFVIDFLRCTSMDSTFLGVLAGIALQLRKVTPRGNLVLTRLGPRNLELIRNLGLHKLLAIDGYEGGANFEACDTALECGERGELENARLVLEAHENLVSADEANRGKFQDVLIFMKNRVEQG
jgi:anti-sigma B factor antagonist